MTPEIERWAVAEQQILKDELSWLKAGGRIVSPNGEDISAMKISQLERRLEGVNGALADLEKLPFPGREF